MELLILFGAFTMLMLIGTPIAFCLGALGGKRTRPATRRQIGKKPWRTP